MSKPKVVLTFHVCGQPQSDEVLLTELSDQELLDLVSLDVHRSEI